MPAINRISTLSIIATSLLTAFIAVSSPAFAQPAVPNYAANATDPGSYNSPPAQAKLVRTQNWFLDAKAKASNYAQKDFVGQEQVGTQNSQLDLPAPEQMYNAKKPDKKDIRSGALGFIEPGGRYSWDGRTGVVPNPTLAMPGHFAPNDNVDGGYLGPVNSMMDALGPNHALRTTVITNGDFGRIMAANAQMAAEMRSDPDRWRHAMKQSQQGKQSMTSSLNAGKAEANQDTGFDNTIRPLINIANEDTWVPCASDAPYKSYGNAAWMVGQMYKQVYIPMAILLLLPGAVMTQMKVVVRTGFLFGGNSHDDDMVNPFSGIMRSIIAVFLIPATQLFVSYTIDVGNSLTYEVINFKPYFDLNIVEEWRNDQTFDPKKAHNFIPNLPQNQGKFANTAEKDTFVEQQNYVTSAGQQWFNTLNELLGQGVVALNAFQLVMILYLFLLGPVAAALFAWPGIFGDVFRKVYASWMNGVVLVVLWKFWWAIILLAMAVRLESFQDAMGGMPAATDTYEMFTCAAFVAILMYVPFNPFDFRPGDLVDSVLEKAQQQAGKGGSGSAATGGAGAGSGSAGTGSGAGGAGGGAGRK